MTPVVERSLIFAGVAALHLGLLMWAASSLSQTPPKITPPSVVGVLITLDTPPAPAPAPPAPPPPAPPPPPPEPPPPPPPKPRPEPPKPVPKPAKPKPPPLPPSEKAITVPQETAEPAPAPAPVVAAAPAAPAAASPAQSVPGPSSNEVPITPPRSDARHLNNPKPEYPRTSMRLREEGQVLLDVYILADGTVGEVKLRQSSGFSRLDESAMKTVKKWKFVPAHRGNEPIASWYVQPITFESPR